MFGYYGSKSKIVNEYPSPIFDHIIEPFAGVAYYSLKYWDRSVTLIDKYDVIIRVWKYLQQCSPQDILKLPRLKLGQTIDDFEWDCEESKWLMGFLITASPTQPKKSPSKWKVVIRPNTQEYKLNFIANNLFKIKHWNFICGDYTLAKNEKATWFIDPPYQFGGEYYKYSNSSIDYVKLADWCKAREGQIIICENSKANWMEFSPLIKVRGSKKTSIECMWTNIQNQTGKFEFDI